ncbi:hypothetical protein [uncultured Dialister sp.]|uniref:hypothetical protein n=1 Tax=uncultured Dialister sp. TaxID=278064 RepID=UPI0025D8DDB4|nr:hypothetical protein [uncultured Dialister sp.]
MIFSKVKEQCVGMHCSFTLGKTTRWAGKRMTVAAVHSFLPCPQAAVFPPESCSGKRGIEG